MYLCIEAFLQVAQLDKYEGDAIIAGILSFAFCLSREPSDSFYEI